MERLADALRYEPCSPKCANWLRYGIQPKNPRPGLVPGQCKGKAHRYDHLGYAGRRVLVSRKWSGKTLADHRGNRESPAVGHHVARASVSGDGLWRSQPHQLTAAGTPGPAADARNAGQP